MKPAFIIGLFLLVISLVVSVLISLFMVSGLLEGTSVETIGSWLLTLLILVVTGVHLVVTSEPVITVQAH